MTDRGSEHLGSPVTRELPPGGGRFNGPHTIKRSNHKSTNRSGIVLVVPETTSDRTIRVRTYEGNMHLRDTDMQGKTGHLAGPLGGIDGVFVVPTRDYFQILNGSESPITLTPVEEAPVMHRMIDTGVDYGGTGLSEPFVVGSDPVEVTMANSKVTIEKDTNGKHFVTPPDGQRVEIKEDKDGMSVINIGREPVGKDGVRNNIRIQQPGVSSGHAAIVYRAGVIQIMDRASSNGTGYQKKVFR